jgi:hypothetical protein
MCIQPYDEISIAATWTVCISAGLHTTLSSVFLKILLMPFWQVSVLLERSRLSCFLSVRFEVLTAVNMSMLVF